MKKAFTAILSICAIAAGSAMVAAPQIRPGEMTQARVWVENRGMSEALPVIIESMSTDSRPLRVETIGTTEVALVPSTVVQTRIARQAWDYRVVAIAAGQDAAQALSNAGGEGWEAVGLQMTAQGAMAVLLKRPR